MRVKRTVSQEQKGRLLSELSAGVVTFHYITTKESFVFTKKSPFNFRMIDNLNFSPKLQKSSHLTHPWWRRAWRRWGSCPCSRRSWWGWRRSSSAPPGSRRSLWKRQHSPPWQRMNSILSYVFFPCRCLLFISYMTKNIIGKLIPKIVNVGSWLKRRR